MGILRYLRFFVDKQHDGLGFAVIEDIWERWNGVLGSRVGCIDTYSANFSTGLNFEFEM